MRNIKEVRNLSNFLKKIFQENNLIIVIPAIIVVLIITSFMIYGFSQPRSTLLSENDTLIVRQGKLEEYMMNEYNSANHTPSTPYIKQNPYGISPLSALMMFDTAIDSSFMLVVKGKTEEADLEFVTDISKDHQIPIYGLYEGTTSIELYEYSKVDQTRGELLYSTELTTEIRPIDVLKLPDATIETTYEYFGDDFMMLSPATSNLPVAYDYNGDMRWYINTPLGFGPDFLENGHLLIGTDRIISDPYYTTGLYEMDYLGKIYKEYYIPGGYHHDAVELPSGNLLVLSNDFSGTVEDIVIEIDRTTGEVVKTWDIADYIPTTEGMSAMWTSSDWFHNNSIDFDANTQSIILSGRHQDAVISISYNTKELNWIIGDPENWDTEGLVETKFFTPTGDGFEWQYAQHSAIVLPNGNIFLFDNGNNKSKDSESYVPASSSYSRGVIYNIDTDTMEISQVYQYGKELGSEYYSPYISNVAYYDDGNYMIHSGGISYSSIEGPLNIPAPLYRGEGTIYENSITVEVMDGEEVYRLRVSGNYYRSGRFTPYSENTSFELGAGLSLGNQEKTEEFTSQYETSYTFFETIPTDYNFSLTKETDRLVVKGIFNRYDDIYLELEDENGTIPYHIPTSKSAYTAMCSAVFQGDERSIIYYINEQELEGDYRIYLTINGKRYDTYRDVEFK